MLLWSAAWLPLSEISNRGRDIDEGEQEIAPFPPGKNSYLSLKIGFEVPKHPS
jgi:hypothetical protein